MLKTSLAVIALLATTSFAQASCDRYGNCYGSGGYNYNYRTGSTWTNRNTSSGSYGTDSSGNSWNYNRNSGNYYNYGTGEMRQRGRRYGW